MSDYVTIGGVSTLDYNALLLDDYIEGAVRDYEVVKVPGRNGDLHIDNGRFQNRNRTITLYFSNGKADIEAFDAYLQSKAGYVRIESTLNPNIYMMGQYEGRMRPKRTAWYDSARANFVFDCKPQKFLLTGEESITVDGTQVIENETGFDAYPIIRVTDAGTYTVSGGDIVVTSFDDNYLDIDSELKMVYGTGANTNMAQYVTLPNNKFPVISAGTSYTFNSNGNASFTVTPRWYTI